jgi:hypothetical protein
MWLFHHCDTARRSIADLNQTSHEWIIPIR